MHRLHSHGKTETSAMKAIARTTYGGPEVLVIKDVSKPQPKPNEVLVRVHASTISRTDCGILWGAPFVFRFFIGLSKPKRSITGSDFAGVVEEVGAEVTRFKKGDRIWGFNDEGLESHAEYVVVKADEALEKIPEGISFTQAAASAEGAHYALNYILSQKMSAGQRILLNGGTGAIGSAAIQMLKDLGAFVVATAPTSHLQVVKDLGADEVLDFQKEDFTQCGQKFYCVFDSVGKSEWKKCKPLLMPGGRYISSELGPGAQNLYLPLLTAFSSRKMKFPLPANRKRSLAHVNGLLAKGAFKPLIDKVIKPEQALEAFNYVHSGKKIGNVVIDFS